MVTLVKYTNHFPLDKTFFFFGKVHASSSAAAFLRTFYPFITNTEVPYYTGIEVRLKTVDSLHMMVTLPAHTADSRYFVLYFHVT